MTFLHATTNGARWLRERDTTAAPFPLVPRSRYILPTLRQPVAISAPEISRSPWEKRKHSRNHSLVILRDDRTGKNECAAGMPYLCASTAMVEACKQPQHRFAGRTAVLGLFPLAAFPRLISKQSCCAIVPVPVHPLPAVPSPLALKLICLAALVDLGPGSPHRSEKGSIAHRTAHIAHRRTSFASFPSTTLLPGRKRTG